MAVSEARKQAAAPAVVHLIGNAHIDPVWLWRKAEGLAETKATFRSALDRMRETPEYVFTASSAALYAWVEQNDPELFREIQARVAEGRWGLVGGWWIEPDCNIPAGESLVRQGLQGQRYFREKFGRLCAVGFCVDSFGHAGTLPKILAGCRLRAYVFMRPQQHENGDIPLLAFRWRADDRSQVTALRIPRSYAAWTVEALREKIVHNVELAAGAALGSQTFAFYGVGNHGGGPTRELLAWIDARQRDGTGPRLHHARMDEVLAYAEGCRLPEWQGEMQHHARGCYAAVSAIKQANRRAEGALISAEMWAAAAWMDSARRPGSAVLRTAWRDVLFNQFHDILAGSSVAEACEDAVRQFHGAEHAAAEEANAARQAISWRIDTRPPGTPLVVFNDLPTPFRGVVETEDVGFLTAESAGEPAFLDPEGKPVPCQSVTPHTICGRRRFALQVEVPALGYTVLHERTAPGGTTRHQLGDQAVRVRRQGRRARSGTEHGEEVPGTEHVMQNEFLRVGLTRDGYLTLHDRRQGQRVFQASGGAIPLVIQDHSDTWSHGVDAFPDVVGRFTAVRAQLRESGPVRARLAVDYRWEDSLLTLEYFLGVGERHVTVRARVDWREHWQLLKLAFPLPFKAEEWTAEIPFGTAVRPTNGQEEPVQRWVDLSGPTRGLAVANDGRHGCSAEADELRVTILRSPPYAFHDPFRPQDFAHHEFTDQGVQTFALILLPHAGDWRKSGIIELARQLNRLPATLSETFHSGPLPPTAGFVECGSRGVCIEALKEAEEGDALILRAVEWFGAARTARFALPAMGQEWRVRFRAHEIKTFRIPAGGGTVTEVDLLEE